MEDFSLARNFFRLTDKEDNFFSQKEVHDIDKLAMQKFCFFGWAGGLQEFFF